MNYIYHDLKQNYKFKHLRVLPYLEGIDKQLIENYNLYMLKKKYNYEILDKNLYNYDNNYGRYITYHDNIEKYKSDYISINKLYKNLLNQLKVKIEEFQINNNYFKLNYYKSWYYDIEKNLHNTLIRIYTIINNYKPEKIKKSNFFTINKLIYLLLVIFSVFILIYDITS